jgi:protein involved in ribonucleotide reduction
LRSFELIGLVERKISLLVEYDSKNKNFMCSNGHHGKTKHNEQNIKAESRTLPCNTVNKTRVLVVYTANAVTTAGNVSVIYNRVINALNSFNNANSLSAVATSTGADLELAGFE